MSFASLAVRASIYSFFVYLNSAHISPLRSISRKKVDFVTLKMIFFTIGL